MYFDNLEDIKQYADEIICFYSDNNPYVKYEVEKDFADKIASEQVLIPNAGHINSESGYDTFEEIDTTMEYAMVNQNNVKNSHRKYIT